MDNNYNENNEYNDYKTSTIHPIKLKSELYNHNIETLQKRERIKKSNYTMIGFAIGFFVLLIVLILIVLLVR